MDVRAHRSAHEAAEAMPLVTDSATVTDVTTLDHNRNGAVEWAVASALEARGIDRFHRYAPDGDPRVEWTALRRALEADDVHDDGEVRTLCERHRRPYPSLLSVGLDMDADFDFVPGQYVTVRFHGTPRPYSIASSPNADETRLCIRRVPGGRLTSDLFEQLDRGDEVTVRGPQGEFVPAEPSPRDLAFLATGTGVAPLKSMIEYTLEEGHDRYEGHHRDLWLFLGASWEDDLAYRERFRDLDAEHDHVHFVPSCTREPLLSDWDGETEYVQRVLVKYLADTGKQSLPDGLARYCDRAPATDIEARIDPGNLEVYACGVNAMVNQLVEAATTLGVPERFVDAEGYG